MKKIVLVLFAVIVGLASCNNEEKKLEKEIKDYLEAETHKVVEVIEYSKIEDLSKEDLPENYKDLYFVSVKYRIGDNIDFDGIFFNKKDNTVSEVNYHDELLDDEIHIVDSLGNYVDDDGNVIQIVDSI